jgi:hypothetical protein
LSGLFWLGHNKSGATPYMLERLTNAINEKFEKLTEKD